MMFCCDVEESVPVIYVLYDCYECLLNISCDLNFIIPISPPKGQLGEDIGSLFRIGPSSKPCFRGGGRDLRRDRSSHGGRRWKRTPLTSPREQW